MLRLPFFILHGVLFLVVSFSGAICFSEAQKGETLSRVNVRENAALDSKVLVLLKKGARVLVTPHNDQWFTLLQGPYAGKFVSKEFIKTLPGEVSLLEANREYAESMGTGFLAQKNYFEGRAYLENYLFKDSTYAKGWNLLGQMYLGLEKWSEAGSSFEKASEFSSGKEKGIYLHSAADAFARAGNMESATRTLASSENSFLNVSGVLASQVAHMKNLIKAGQAIPQLDLAQENTESTSQFSGFIGLKTGYDSNVLLLPDDINATQTSGSFLLNPLGQISYGMPLGAGSLSAQSATSFTAYEKDSVQTSNNLYESVVVEWGATLKEDQFFTPLYGSRFDLSLVNTSGLAFFSWTETLYFNAAKKIAQDQTLIFELPLGYQKFSSKIITNGSDNRSGLLLTPSLLYNYKLGEWSFNGGGSYSDVYAIGQNYKTRGYTLLLGFNRTVYWGVKLSGSASFTETWYRENPNQRKDNKYDFSLNLSKPLPFYPQVNVSLSSIYTINDSSITSARYDRSTTILQAAYGF